MQLVCGYVSVFVEVLFTFVKISSNLVVLDKVVRSNTLERSTCLELAAITKDVGLPDGVFNVITGLGPDAGAPLASHPGVDKVLFRFSLMLLKKLCKSSCKSGFSFLLTR